jgi:hypothetical protein
MTAGLRVFEIELPTIGALAAWRDFNEQLFPYRLERYADVWSMTVDDAARLGRCADVIMRRFNFAARRGESVKSGPLFIRKEDSGELIIEIGIVDDESIYLQLFDLPKLTLRDEQSRKLLVALRRVGDDARGISGGGGGGIASRLAR